MKAQELQIDIDWWVISDTHFSHDNIIRYCDRPPNHDELMWMNWNLCVGSDDPVLHLGDLCFMQGWLEGLNGRKFLLKGNHDHEKPSWYREQGFEMLEGAEHTPYTSRKRGTIRYKHGFYWDAPDGRRVLFSHFPDETVLNWDVNIHGHIHNNPYSEDLDTSRNYVNVSVEVINYTPVRLEELLKG